MVSSARAGANGWTTREVQLVARPQGQVKVSDFALVERPVPPPGAGEALVENVLMSVDPYLRLTLDGALPLGTRLIAGGIGRVVEAGPGGPTPGTLVRHRQGYAERFTCAASGLTPLDPDPDLPLEAYISVLGGIGLCAYVGLLGVGRMQAGEQVFVSSAAGAVGSLAVQVARLKGCRVVGSAGSPAKAAWVRDVLGADVAIDYKAEPIEGALARATPDGIDVYFENVGGDHLTAALARMNPGGRIPVCGMIANYDGRPAPVTGLEQVVVRRLTMKGFGFTDHPELEPAFHAEMTGWLKSGALVRGETVLEGLDRTPEALVGLFDGRHVGKVLVRV